MFDNRDFGIIIIHSQIQILDTKKKCFLELKIKITWSKYNTLDDLARYQVITRWHENDY